MTIELADVLWSVCGSITPYDMLSLEYTMRSERDKSTYCTAVHHPHKLTIPLLPETIPKPSVTVLVLEAMQPIDDDDHAAFSPSQLEEPGQLPA